MKSLLEWVGLTIFLIFVVGSCDYCAKYDEDKTMTYIEYWIGK